MFRAKAIILVISGFLFYSLALGDVIYFKDGRKVEGVIVSQDSSTIKIKTKYGTNEFSMDLVDRVETKKTKDQEYQDLVKSTDPRDVDAVMKLVKWCTDNNLESKAKKHLREIIKLDPNNEEARGQLGYVKHEGKWVTPRELKALQNDAEREKKIKAGFVEYKGEWMPAEDVEKLKAGMVKYKDAWVTPEEKDRLEQNLVLYEGQWVKKEDAEKMEKGLFKVGDQWVAKEEADRIHADWENPWDLRIGNVRIKTNKHYDYAQKMLADAKFAYDKIYGLMKVDPDVTDYPLTVYVLASLEEYNNIGNNIGDERSSSYMVFFVEESPEDGPVSVTYTRSDPKKGDTDNYVRYSLGLVRHAVVEHYMRRIDEKEEIPIWFILGQATKVDRFATDKYIAWYIKELRKLGGFLKMKQFLDNTFGYSEQEIYQAGLICSYLDSNDVSEKIKAKYQDVLKAMANKKKVSSEFASFEKALMKDEKNIRAYMGKH